MKLTSNRTYLDHNATAPLSPSVYQWLTKGVFLFGNPSSIHESGKKSKKLINKTISTIKEVFKLPDYETFFHSGATEGINSIVKGFCFNQFKDNKSFHFVCLSTDHPCVVNQREFVEVLGGSFHLLEVDRNGDFDLTSVITYISKLQGKVLLNYTLVNNETGIHWPLDLAVKIKQQTKCLIHVDAVQMVGKISKELALDDSLDFYTFSGHKFGALKGVGFSLLKNKYKNWSSLIHGGPQQMGMRSGTENIHGIYSIKLALDDICSHYDPTLLKQQRDLLEESLVSLGAGKIYVTAKNSRHRNYNTIFMIIKGTSAELLLTAFDLAQIDLSSGSACSSGVTKASRVLLAMGYPEEDARNSIRISLPSYVQSDTAEVIFLKLSKVLERFI